MKRALLVGTNRSDILFFLKYLKREENSEFQTRKTEFEDVLFLTADVVGDRLVLDVTAKELVSLGNNAYKAEGLWKPEVPQEMKGFKNQTNGKKEENPDRIC